KLRHQLPERALGALPVKRDRAWMPRHRRLSERRFACPERRGECPGDEGSGETQADESRLGRSSCRQSRSSHRSAPIVDGTSGNPLVTRWSPVLGSIRMEFRVLGPVEVRDGDHELPLGGQLQRALLALLLTRANEVVPTDRLIDVLWSGSPPRAARNVIQGHVSDLRKLLGRGVIVTHRSGYAIVVEPERLDLHRFERLLEEGSGALADGRPVEAAGKLREGLALWRGQALADVADEPELRLEVGRLEELRLVALERRVDADLALG